MMSFPYTIQDRSLRGGVEDLKEPHTSVIRNKKIADVFHQAGYVETWGKGIELIRDSCKENGNPDPIFNVRRGGPDIRFAPSRFIEYDLPLKLPTDLSENEVNVCKLIDMNRCITIGEIIEQLGISERTVKRTLKSLAEKEIIARVGPSRGGTWRFI